MPHFPKPWFRKSRGVWMVQIAGVQHNLGADRELAFQRYHDLMRRPAAKPVPSEAVVGVIDSFLDWCHAHRSAETYQWYLWRLQRFIASIDTTLCVQHVRHFHLDNWLQQNPGWS